MGFWVPFAAVLDGIWYEESAILWTALQASKTRTQKSIIPPTNASFVHCVGDNFLPSAWIYRSCQMRNLCWQGSWTLFPTKHSRELEEMWPHSSYARHSTSWNGTTVSPIATNPFAFRNHKYSWSPNISWDDGFFPPMLDPNVIGVPMYVQPPITMTLGLLTQVLLPVYNLLAMFGWQDETHIHVYLLNPEDCDDDCQKCLRVGLESFMGYRLVVDSPTEPFCLRRAAVGMGLLSAEGLSSRGYDAKDYMPPRAAQNAGRGGTLWHFRTALLSRRNWEHDVAIEKMERARVILATRHDSDGLGDLVGAMKKLFLKYRSPQPQVQALDEIVKESSISPELFLLHIAEQTNFWVAQASDDASTWPAFFMPRGSTLVLLYNTTLAPKRSQQIVSDHPVYPDFGFWNHVSHLKVHWLALPQGDEQTRSLMTTLEPLIYSQLNIKAITTNTVGHTSSFNGEHTVDLLVQPPVNSTIHCIGENWEWDAVNYRSCLVKNICLDLMTKQFTIIPDQSIPSTRGNYISTEDNDDKSVMMGQSIRLGSGDPWFPKKRTTTNESYYSLPPDIVWLPFYAQIPNANNPGHLLWDYFLSLYTLAELFIDVKGKTLLLTNLDIDCVPTNPKDSCYNLTRKFLPLFDGHAFFNADASYLKRTSEYDSSHESNLVCASTGAIGIGMLTDHGVKKHGQLLEDYQNVRNAGRGVAFWRFRNFMLGNLALARSTANQIFTITFSINSSKNPSRRRNFSSQIQWLKSQYPFLRVQAVQLDQLSLREQVEVILSSNIFVSVIGGSAATAMFLERNSCLILYYNDVDDFVKDHRRTTAMPAMLDWDFWNNASYLRVHWLPISSMDQDLQLFGTLMENEVESQWQWQ